MPIHRRGACRCVAGIRLGRRTVLVDRITVQLLYVLFECLLFGHGHYGSWGDARLFHRRSEAHARNVAVVIRTAIALCWIFRIHRSDAGMVKLGPVLISDDVFCMDRIIGRIQCRKLLQSWRRKGGEDV